LVSFLLGHLSYCHFMSPLVVSAVTVLSGFLTMTLCVSSAFVWVFFRPYLGDMKLAVGVYIFVISVMVLASILTVPNGAVPFKGRMQLLFASVLFYISDILVAYGRFVRPPPLTAYVCRILCLAFYFVAQFLLASVRPHL